MSDTSQIPAVEIATRTDPGRDPDKQVNEDSAAHVETALGMLAVVCDGMGGHAGGKEASELALLTIVDTVQSAPRVASPHEVLKRAIEDANEKVWTMPTAESGYRPGSTVVAVLAHAAGAEIAHVGDSRVYLVHAGAISQVTKDHSMVQEMVDRNLIRAEDAATHPDANKILRALGIAKECEVDLRMTPLPFVAGDVFVLCSDGLSDLVGPSEILEMVGSRPCAQAAGQLVDLANARGGHDNITVTVMRMKAGAMVTDAPTIAKTVQFTAHAEPPKDLGSGPRGTLMATPAVPPPPPSVQSHRATPAIPPAPISDARPRSRMPIVAGLLLALVGLAIAGVIVWTLSKPRHINVPLVDAQSSAHTNASDAATEDDDAATTPTAPVPPLLPPSAVPWWKDPDASTPTGEPRECLSARWAKKKNKPAATVEDLEAKCRAKGGRP